MPFLFAELPPVFVDSYDEATPWTLLGKALDEVLEALPSSLLEGSIDPDAHLLGDRIVVERGARVAAGAVIEGPIYLGPDSQVRAGAYLRGGCWIGAGCTVGANTEIKHSILLPGAKAPHLNYVGDSILGAGVNLGAGTVLSNFRQDGGEVRVKSDDGDLATGRRKLGAILGDGVKTGCNSVLHPGVVVGRESEIYPGVQLRSGIVPVSTLVKLRQQLEFTAKR